MDSVESGKYDLKVCCTCTVHTVFGSFFFMYLDPDLFAESYPDKRALNRNTVLNSVLPTVSECIFLYCEC